MAADDCKLYVVHGTAAGIRCQVFFYDSFRSPVKAGGQDGKCCSIENGFDELVIGHSIYLCEKLFLTWDIYPV